MTTLPRLAPIPLPLATVDTKPRCERLYRGRSTPSVPDSKAHHLSLNACGCWYRTQMRSSPSRSIDRFCSGFHTPSLIIQHLRVLIPNPRCERLHQCRSTPSFPDSTPHHVTFNSCECWYQVQMRTSPSRSIDRLCSRFQTKSIYHPSSLHAIASHCTGRYCIPTLRSTLQLSTAIAAVLPSTVRHTKPKNCSYIPRSIDHSRARPFSISFIILLQYTRSRPIVLSDIASYLPFQLVHFN